ncbi:hypothetical protein ES703_26070 [subsurface metagenome]
MEANEKFDEEKKIQELIRKIPQDLGDLTEAVIRLRIEYVKRLRDLSRTYGVDFTEEALEGFLKRPYAILPKSGERNEFYVAVPKFVDFQVGYLDHSTDSFNIFIITKYTQWLGQVIPEDLREELDFRKPEPITVTDGVISFPEEYEPVVAQRYGGYLTSISKGKARIRPGNEFDLIAEIIDNGSLPFVPKQVAEADLRSPEVKFEPKGKYSYQRDAFDTFLKYGAIGIFWMPGSGKTFIGMFILDNLKGKKLVVCPGITMIEQWKSDIAEWAPRLKEELESGELEIVTYHAYPKIRGREHVCVIFDECHRLPADTFSRMATIKAKYRVGLSATPFREDGRTNYIFSLTGYPIGLDWKALVKLLGKTFHEVDVYILKNEREKLARVMELVDPKRKTQIFSDGIGLGKRIAQKLGGVPFVHGETKKNRLEILRKEPVVVVSRVGDLGVSIKDLEHLVEADFLMGSRTQELSRSTRLFHSMAKIKRHDILFTEDEFYLYRKRLHGLVERGFKINVQRFVRKPIVEAPIRRPHMPRRTVERVPKIREPTEEERKVAAPFIQRKLKEIERVVNELTPNQRRILKFMTIAKQSPKSKIARALGIEKVNADVDGLVKLGLLRKHPKHGFFYNLGRKVTSDLLTFKASAVGIKDAVKQIEKLIKEWE